MVIILHWKSWLEDVRVYRMEQIADAQIYVDGLPSDRTAYVFNLEHPLQEEIEGCWMAGNARYSSAQLVEIYNALSAHEDRIKGFHDRDIAFRRIGMRLIQRADESSVLALSTGTKIMTMEQTEGQEVSDAGKKKRTKKEKVATEPKGPGVIGSLKEFLQAGGGTKAALYEKLAERFPDKATDVKGMRITIDVQLNRLAKDGVLNISKEGKGADAVYTGELVEAA